MPEHVIDRTYGDRFLPEIKKLITPHLLVPTPDLIDQKEAADLMVLHGIDKRIAVRVRRPGYADQYPHQFTIRCQRDTGTETELSKIINGWGDWLFYGHATEDEKAVKPWWLIDLRAFRAALIREARNGMTLKSGDMPNGDGTYFKWFDIRSFPPHPPLVIASSEPYFG
jgi:hypothetical protein